MLFVTNVWVEIDNYWGPSFFDSQNVDRNKWVPIFPISVAHDDDRNGMGPYGKKSHAWRQQNQIPLRLAYGWTIWKTQGLGYDTPIVLHLGDYKLEHGLTYTAFSGAVLWHLIGIHGNITKERLTDQLIRLKKMKERLKEDARLEKLQRDLIDSQKNVMSQYFLDEEPFINDDKNSYGTNDVISDDDSSVFAGPRVVNDDSINSLEGEFEEARVKYTVVLQKQRKGGSKVPSTISICNIKPRFSRERDMVHNTQKNDNMVVTTNRSLVIQIENSSIDWNARTHLFLTETLPACPLYPTPLSSHFTLRRTGTKSRTTSAPISTFTIQHIFICLYIYSDVISLHSCKRVGGVVQQWTIRFG